MKTKTIIFLLVVVVVAFIGTIYLWSNELSFPPFIPHCPASDIIVGSGEYSEQTGYWSEYNCASEVAFGDRGYVDRKSGD